MCRRAALALLLAAACKPEGGIKLVYAHGADASPVVQKRLKALMIRSAHVVVEGEKLAVYVPGGRRLDDVKAALSKRGALEMSLVVDTHDFPVAPDSLDVNVNRDSTGSAYIEGDSRELVEAEAKKLWPAGRVFIARDGKAFRSWVLDGTPLITHVNIADASDTLDQITTSPAIDIVFDEAGKSAFAKGTAAAIGRRLAIIVDDEVKSVPVVMNAIRDGRARMTLGAHAQLIEARTLAAALKSGALPQPLVLESEAPYAPREF